MRYYRLPGPRLIARTEDAAYDLTSVTNDVLSFRDLARTANVAGEAIDALATKLAEQATAIESDEITPGRPCHPDEVWAAGVTYAISEEAREEESGMPEMYLDVYEAERPEVFFKATPSRTVGPGEAVGIRADSDWDVPEPELAVVLYDGEIVGYTIGNDMSSRSIEGANPLYLPQAKVYERCCAIGPCVASTETIGEPHDLEMGMTIERDGETVFDGVTSTGEMVRSCEELVEYYTKHNAVPKLAVLLTGTSLVPPDEFTLTPGDQVTIDIEGIGTLANAVIEV